MLLGLLLSLNILVCLALIGVVLLQRSEGGALGGGGGPTGLVTTRGAGDLLTRTTWILFAIFLTLSLSLTLIGGRQRSTESILNRLKTEHVDPNSLKRTAPATPDATTGAGSLPAAPAAPLSAPSAAAGLPAAALAAPKPTVRLAPRANTAAAPNAPIATPGGFLAAPKPTIGLTPAPAAPATTTAPAPAAPAPSTPVPTPKA